MTDENPDVPVFPEPGLCPLEVVDPEANESSPPGDEGSPEAHPDVIRDDVPDGGSRGPGSDDARGLRTPRATR